MNFDVEKTHIVTDILAHLGIPYTSRVEGQTLYIEVSAEGKILLELDRMLHYEGAI